MYNLTLVSKVSGIGRSRKDNTMPDGRFVSYLRVSSQDQKRSGLGIEAQREAVARYLNGGDWKLLAEFEEVESGKSHENRPKLAEAMALCRRTGATLVIARLDRLSRNIAFLASLMESKVPFVACDNPHATKFTVHILGAVAEHEREMIAARTKAALQAARDRGQMLGGWRGGPKVDTAAGTAARTAKADAYAADVGPIATRLRAEGMSLRQVAARMAEQGIRTPRDGAWSAAAVKALLERVGPVARP